MQRQRPLISAAELPGLIGLAAILAGAYLLAQGLIVDLHTHALLHHALIEQLPPQLAEIVIRIEEREEANPWHIVLIAGQVLLTAGLAILYFGERAGRRRLQALLDTRPAATGPSLRAR